MPLSLSPFQPAPPKNTLRIALLISVAINGAAILWIQFDLPDIKKPVAAGPIDVFWLNPQRPDELKPIEIPPDEVVPANEAPLEPVTTELQPDPDERPTDEQEPFAAEMLESDDTLTTPSQSERAGPDPLVADANAANYLEDIDWQAVISTHAADMSAENFESEEHRERMWRKTFSVMFQPPEEWLKEEKPYLPDLPFESDKPKRLGIQISENCYLGFGGIDPKSVDTDAPGWSGGGDPQPTIDLLSCGFGG